MVCSGIDFTRNRKQSFEDIVRSILALNGGVLTNELFSIYNYSPNTPSASAFVQQRAKLSEDAMPTLFQNLNNVFDNGCRYEGYNNLAHIQESGHKYVIRIKEKGGRGIIDGLDIDDEEEFDMNFNLSLTRKGSNETKVLAKEDKNRYRIIPGNIKFDYLSTPKYKDPAEFYVLKFRVVRIEVADGIYAALITNLNSKTFTAQKLKEIYGMRWGIETSFRHLKYVIGMLKFHSRKS